MNLTSKKSSLLLLGIIALACSRVMFSLFKDPEGPNVLIVVVVAVVLYVLSLISYLSKLSTSKKFLFAVLIQILFATGIFFYGTHTGSPAVIPPTATPPIVTISEPVFSWRYEADDSLNGDGLPQTNVYLETSYSSLKKTSKLVATVPGSCNDLPDREKDSALNSSVAQCYAAGYGDLFKITKGERSYLVMRRVFEEGSPEYNPPVQPYKVVLEIPLSL